MVNQQSLSTTPNPGAELAETGLTSRVCGSSDGSAAPTPDEVFPGMAPVSHDLIEKIVLRLETEIRGHHGRKPLVQEDGAYRDIP